jgi:hypothetical protein
VRVPGCLQRQPYPDDPVTGSSQANLGGGESRHYYLLRPQKENTNVSLQPFFTIFLRHLSLLSALLTYFTQSSQGACKPSRRTSSVPQPPLPHQQLLRTQNYVAGTQKKVCVCALARCETMFQSGLYACTASSRFGAILRQR